MKRTNPDAYKTVATYELGTIGGVRFELQVWRNDSNSRWVLMMRSIADGVREHADVNDQTAAMLLRNVAEA